MTKIKNTKRDFQQRGGVSIFIVIFTSLLVTVVAASFTQIMLKTQQNASTNDLSQSAYDSALAGVEDAKRALVRYQECANNNERCEESMKAAFDTDSCTTLGDSRVNAAEFVNGEVEVGGDASLNQAYTCAKIELQSDSVEGEDISTKPVVIPLKTNEDFDYVTISWFSDQDLKSIDPDTTTLAGSLPDSSLIGKLPKNRSEQWGEKSPALMRAQLIQYSGNDIDLDEFSSEGTKTARTAFLYPSATGSTSVDLATDSRRETTVGNSAKFIKCSITPDKISGEGQYACQATLKLPPISDRTAFLQLQTYYQSRTHYSVVASSGPIPSPSNIVKFDGVQPVVDATGRASDLFRRVRANINLLGNNRGPEYPFPDAALTVKGDLCKQFFVTNRTSDYAASLNETGGSECSP